MILTRMIRLSESSPHSRLPLLLAPVLLWACSGPPPAVENGKQIQMLYQAKTVEGILVDANPEDGPIEFVVGAGKLQPKVEAKLIGLPLNQEKTFAIQDAYGAYDPSKTGRIGLHALPDDAAVGDEVVMVDGLPSKIKEIRSDGVILDLNHPLAGKEIVFTVKVIAIRDPGPEGAG